MRRFLSASIVIAALGLMAGYLYTQRDALDALRSISLASLMALIGASSLALASQSYQFRAAARINGLHIGIGESTALTASNTIANYYLPARGGMVVRAAYLKGVYRFPLSDYAALSVMLTGLTIIIAAFIGLVGLLGLLAQQRSIEGSAAWALVGATGATAGAVTVAFFVAGRLPAHTRIGVAARQFKEGVRQWAASGRGLVIFLGWTVTLFGLQATRLWLAFRALGVTVDLPSMLVIQAMALIAFVLALTPGNIGVKEGAIVFAARLVRVPADIALLASLLDRAAALVVSLAVGLLSTPYLAARVGSAPPRDGPATETDQDE